MTSSTYTNDGRRFSTRSQGVPSRIFALRERVYFLLFFLKNFGVKD